MLKQELDKISHAAKDYKRKCIDLERNIELSQFSQNTYTKTSEETIQNLKAQIEELKKTLMKTKLKYEEHLGSLNQENEQQCHIINSLKQETRQLDQEISNLQIVKENFEQKLEYFKGKLYDSQITVHEKNQFKDEKRSQLVLKLSNLALRVQQLKKELKFQKIDNLARIENCKEIVTCLALKELKSSLSIRFSSGSRERRSYGSPPQKISCEEKEKFKNLTFNPSDKKSKQRIEFYDGDEDRRCSNSSRYNFMDSEPQVRPFNLKSESKDQPLDLESLSREREAQRIRLGLPKTPSRGHSKDQRNLGKNQFLLNSEDSRPSNRFSKIKESRRTSNSDLGEINLTDRKFSNSRSKKTKKSTPDFLMNQSEDHPDKENIQWLANKSPHVLNSMSPGRKDFNKFRSENKDHHKFDSRLSLVYQSEMTQQEHDMGRMKGRNHSKKLSLFDEDLTIFEKKKDSRQSGMLDMRKVDYLSNLDLDDGNADYFSKKMDKLRQREMELREKRFH